jgi:2-amino-4-hydroxy-6-hydroxymethyldihydropteridine diphosphokinase
MEPETLIAYLSLGSNLGDRAAALRRGLRILQSESLRVLRTSRWYETEPVGVGDQPWFVNLVAEVATSLSPEELLGACCAAENALGRARPSRGAPRTLDVDILTYGNRVHVGDDLVIPHLRMTRRRFVLEPLAELAPDLIHPVLGEPIRLLRTHCEDRSEVRLFVSGGVL